MKILHLSDTPLSGAPTRLSNLLRKHANGFDSRHIVWDKAAFGRIMPFDLVGPELSVAELIQWLEWADIIHYHNRWKRQEIFKIVEMPKKPGVIQMHSPRHDNENFSEEVDSKLPIAVVAQYQVREWPEAQFIVPNVVDTTELKPSQGKKLRTIPVISYSPSSCTGKGWNDKGYSVVSPVLKRWKLDRKIIYQLITETAYGEMLELKSVADIGIDDIVTGSYHLSSLEYLSLGVPCYDYLDEKTEKVVKDLTGSDTLPWLHARDTNFKTNIDHFIKSGLWKQNPANSFSRRWMEKYWNPGALCKVYSEMYRSLA